MINPIFNTVVVSQAWWPVMNQSELSIPYFYGDEYKAKQWGRQREKTKIINIEEYLDISIIPTYYKCTEILWDDFWKIVKMFDDDYVLLKSRSVIQKYLNRHIGLHRKIIWWIIDYDDILRIDLYKKRLMYWEDFYAMINMKPVKEHKGEKRIKKKREEKDVMLLLKQAKENIRHWEMTEEVSNFVFNIRIWLKKRWTVVDNLWAVLWADGKSEEEIRNLLS